MPIALFAGTNPNKRHKILESLFYKCFQLPWQLCTYPWSVESATATSEFGHKELLKTERQKDKKTIDNQANRQTDKKTNRKTDKQTKSMKD